MDLLKKAKKGDRDAFADLLTQYQTMLYNTALLILRNEDDALDAVQDALLACWEKLPGLRQEKYFKTWLTRILINHCTNIVRRQRRMVSMEEAEEPVGSLVESDYEFYELLRELPEKDRIIFLLYYGEGFNTREISEILDWNENTVKSRLLRGRKKLEQVVSF